jgi:hypothetical protein
VVRRLGKPIGPRQPTHTSTLTVIRVQFHRTYIAQQPPRSTIAI